MRGNGSHRRLSRPGLVLAAAGLPFLLGIALIGARPGDAADDALARRLTGTWQFVSHKRVSTGEESVRHGGYVVFGTDGYANYFYVASNYRTATKESEREAVLRLMLAWSGRYSAQDGKLVIENAQGTRTRRIKIEGDRLTTVPVKQPHSQVAAGQADRGETVLTRVR